jgi:hypothetical protein
MLQVQHDLREHQAIHNDHFGLHFRYLGNVAYLMASLNTPRKTLAILEGAILRCA